MTVIRCTTKLLKLVAGSPSTEDVQPRASDWYANLLWLDRRKCVLLVHATTLFAAFHPDVSKADLTPLAPFAVALIERELSAEGLPKDTFGSISADDMVVGRTCSRSVLGTMTDLRYQIEAAVVQAGSLYRLDLADLYCSLRRIPFSAVRYARAIDLTRAIESTIRRGASWAEWDRNATA